MENYFAKNLKGLREKAGLSQSELSRITQRICENYNKDVEDDKKLTPITQASIARWEAGENSPSVDNLVLLKNALGIDLVDLIGKNLSFDNATPIDINSDIIKIPVYGTIKAGTPIESQNDIIDYVEIPKEWTNGGKKFFGIKLSGDSMFPKYQDGDTVIFEQNDDIESYKNKDVAVMINHTESTFKKILVNEQGIILQPYNTAYDIMMFSKEQVEQLPIKVVGIAREKRTKID